MTEFVTIRRKDKDPGEESDNREPQGASLVGTKYRSADKVPGHKSEGGGDVPETATGGNRQSTLDKWMGIARSRARKVLEDPQRLGNLRSAGKTNRGRKKTKVESSTKKDELESALVEPAENLAPSGMESKVKLGESTAP